MPVLKQNTGFHHLQLPSGLRNTFIRFKSLLATVYKEGCRKIRKMLGELQGVDLPPPQKSEPEGPRHSSGHSYDGTDIGSVLTPAAAAGALSGLHNPMGTTLGVCTSRCCSEVNATEGFWHADLFMLSYGNDETDACSTADKPPIASRNPPRNATDRKG